MNIYTFVYLIINTYIHTYLYALTPLAGLKTRTVRWYSYIIYIYIYVHIVYYIYINISTRYKSECNNTYMYVYVCICIYIYMYTYTNNSDHFKLDWDLSQIQIIHVTHMIDIWMSNTTCMNDSCHIRHPTYICGIVKQYRNTTQHTLNTLQYTVVYRKVLLHCDLQHTATHTHHTITHRNVQLQRATDCNTPSTQECTAAVCTTTHSTHCNTRQRTHCNTLQHTGRYSCSVHCNTLQHTLNMLQHTLYTLQCTATHRKVQL